MKEPPRTLFAGMTLLFLVSLVSAGIQAWQVDVSLREALERSPVAEAAVAAGVPVIAVEEMRTIVEQGTHLILDARSMGEYDQGHIPGAFSLPQADFESAFMNLAGMFGPQDPLVVYCSSATCDDALLVAERLREAGFLKVSLFLAGWEGWRDE